MTQKSDITINLDEYKALEENIEKIQYERAMFKKTLRNLINGMEQDDNGRVYLEITSKQKQDLENIVEDML